MTSPRKPVETLTPQRNFTLATEDRVRAVAAGPPAFMRRLRAIEDLEEDLLRVLAERREASPAELRALERLNDLVARHDRYYPVEANLAMHPRTGELVDRTGRPWRPMALRSLDELLVRALERFPRG